MKLYQKIFLMGVPLLIFFITEMLLVGSTENIILFYVASIIFFIAIAVKSEDSMMRNYWAVMVLPVILRIVNLSMPFPIMNPKLQLMVTYSLIVFASIIFLNYSGLKLKFMRIGHHSYRQFFLAIIVGITLGSIEYFILGSTPLIQTLILEDAIFIIYIVFMIGLGEELVYRGLLQQIQDDVIGKKAALFISSVLFGIMHLIWRNPIEFFFTTFAGFVFGYQFYKTNSIWVPTLSHALNNYTWLLIWPILTGITSLALPF